MRIDQALLLELDYADGGNHNKKRPYLIIDIVDNKILLLNISSVRGKEYKLGFASNKNIKKYKPPLIKLSFVKLDALYIIENNTNLQEFVLCNGRGMNPIELQEIKTAFYEFRENHKINESNIDIKYLMNMNAKNENAI